MALTWHPAAVQLLQAAPPRRHLAASRRRAAPTSACADCVRSAALLLPAAQARAARRGGAQPRLRGCAPLGAAGEGDAPEGEPPHADAPQETPPPTAAVAVALALLAFYRREISPLMPRSCRFLPSCSEYSIQAFKQFGFWRGGLLTAWRLVRCNPLNPKYGLDMPRWPPFGPDE